LKPLLVAIPFIALTFCSKAPTGNIIVVGWQYSINNIAWTKKNMGLWTAWWWNEWKMRETTV